MLRVELLECLEIEWFVLWVCIVIDVEDIYVYVSFLEVVYLVGFLFVKILEDEIYYLEYIFLECN